MSTNIEYSEVIVTDTVNSRTQPAPTREIKLIPRGGFAGTIYQPGLVKNGELLACDTGEQGGGQN
ncbi:MAG: hypothetical protein JO251_19070 [Verrucomicrobia bacterium]|nr:hypothetical protein [Verrucomicrobiota bacterium]